MESRGSPRWTSCAAAVLGSALLAACGGGSGSGNLSGSAVTGVALSDGVIAGGAVTLTDSSSSAQQRQVSTRSDGSFSVDVSGLAAPFTLRVAWDAGGAPRKLYAIAEGSEALDITPITDLAVAYATGDAGEEALLTATPTQKRLATVQARAVLTDLSAELAPLLNRYAIVNLRTDTEPVRQLLQEVSVTQSAGTVTFSNRRTGRPISTISLTDPQRGSFDPSQIPTGMPPGCFDPGQAPSGGPAGGFDPGQIPSGGPRGGFDPSHTPTGAPPRPPPGASSGGTSSSSSGGTSSGGSSGPTSNLPPGHPAVPSGATCSSCHGGGMRGGPQPGSPGGTSSSGGFPAPPGSSGGSGNLPANHPAVPAGSSCSDCD